MSTLVRTALAIRKATTEDWPGLEEMYEKFESPGDFHPLPPHDPFVRARWLDDLKQGINLVAAEEGKITGHVVLMPSDVVAEVALFVHPDHRRQGIAWSLAEAAVDEARTRKIRSLWVLVSSENYAAVKGLRKFGFHVVWEKDGELQLVFRV